jgi:hypothetical protein
MKKLLAALFLMSGCATTYSAGGHVTDGCDATTDSRAPGYSIYVCHRPFPSQWAAYNGKDKSQATREASSAKGPFIPAGWTDGFTDRAHQEIFVYDVFLPENFEHELRHVRGEIRDSE